jgi:hypothetical protein
VPQGNFRVRVRISSQNERRRGCSKFPRTAELGKSGARIKRGGHWRGRVHGLHPRLHYCAPHGAGRLPSFDLHPFSCLHSSANLWHQSLIGAFAGSSKGQVPSSKEQPGRDSRQQDARREEQPMLRAERWLIHHPKPDVPFRSFRDFRDSRCYPTPSTFPCIPCFSSAAGSGRRKQVRLRLAFSCLHSSANLWHPSLTGAFAGSSKGQVPKNSREKTQDGKTQDARLKEQPMLRAEHLPSTIYLRLFLCGAYVPLITRLPRGRRGFRWGG